MLVISFQAVETGDWDETIGIEIAAIVMTASVYAITPITSMNRNMRLDQEELSNWYKRGRKNHLWKITVLSDVPTGQIARLERIVLMRTPQSHVNTFPTVRLAKNASTFIQSFPASSKIAVKIPIVTISINHPLALLEDHL
jgi:hypothetical protein